MYENSNNSDIRQQWQKRSRRQRRGARYKRILIGATIVLCLLTYARQAIGRSSTIIPVDISTQQPKKVDEVSLIQSPVASPTPAKSSVQENEWNLLLVNPWNSVLDDYMVSLTQLKNGHSVDERCYPDLQAMIDACQAASLNPVICSSYRTQKKQERLFQNQVNQYLAKGYSATEARTEASKAVAIPGTSEHQLGLAVDIVDLSNQNLDNSQEKTPVQKWLMENSWKYGFILRYPNDKSDITGIIYEPWHYRYVGIDVAKEIYEQKICLEEYLAQLKETI